MALQEYLERLPRFVEGMIPDMRTPGEDRSMVVTEDGGIGFGRPVAQATAAEAEAWNEDKRVKAINSGADVFVGVTVLDATKSRDDEDGYPETEIARIRTRGPVVVAVSEAVVAGDLAGVDENGDFIVAADVEHAIGRYEASVDAEELTIVNLTGGLAAVTSA